MLDFVLHMKYLSIKPYNTPCLMNHYAQLNEAPVYKNVTDNKGKTVLNRIQLGTYVKVTQTNGDWREVETAGPGGWMHKDTLGKNMGLKIFFLDVGQGDGVLIEVGDLKILIDAGPNNNLYNYLTKWQYTYLIKDNNKIHIDYLIVSHFDTDHYKGFIKILKDKRFTVGTVCHTGILKFASANNTYNSGLGNVISLNGKKYLTRIFDDLQSLRDPVPFNRDVTSFVAAINTASAANPSRIAQVKRFKAGDLIIQKQVEGSAFKMEVIAPFTERINNQDAFIYWENDEGKTINGHSLLVKITFGNCTFLFGGDLNTLSENYLMQKYDQRNPFEVDVAKSCHHGSSDFSEAFMDKVKPYATVISSGDNESHSHPRADAIGCAGKYSKGSRPLVYSTVLARSVDLKGKKILYGMINARCNGRDIYMNQMKEARKASDIWDAYKVK